MRVVGDEQHDPLLMTQLHVFTTQSALLNRLYLEELYNKALNGRIYRVRKDAAQNS